ncbi:DUF2971 domain-containing protein [Photobacterium carnosum]|uniref:DUF2971 domain-containing protein n=1 Tax=Photobacterium carnosum TaxID=2023717 RepID=UPI001E613A27|nr:DUF2971 domain-containing protein [Photobacterium carnosum]MCD9527242.1 DUF2971 domain-containing protein [Photobacterium carnosum]
MNQTFFKYTTFNTNTINSIICNNLWHAEVTTLNDPFELNFRFKKDIPSDINSLTALFEKNNYFTSDVNKTKEKNAFIKFILNGQSNRLFDLADEIVDSAEERFSEQVKDSKPFICSMSQFNNDPLMWSHYSDGMKGICIAYDIDDLESTGLELKEVIYKEIIHEVDFFKTNEDYKRSGANFNSKELSDIYISKHNRWEYEGEYRSILWPETHEIGKLGVQHKIPDTAIKAIIYGHRISDLDLCTLKQLAKLKKIPLFKASPNYSEGKVIIGKVD